MTISEWQLRLSALYDLELELDVTRFLCDEAEARALGGEDATRRGEVLFVRSDDDGAAVSLYVDAAALSLAHDEGWLGSGDRFRACCLATEGLSHLVYVAFRDLHEHEVSELELELQAEVDKWAMALLAPWRGIDRARLLAGRGVGLVQLRDRSRRLRARMFSDVSFLDDPGTERGDRYRAATRLAARYSRTLEHTLLATGRIDDLARELRRFYRLGAREKIERIELR